MEYKVAKYFQIEQDIIEAIKSGRLKPGDKVDSESVLKKNIMFPQSRCAKLSPI